MLSIYLATQTSWNFLLLLLLIFLLLIYFGLCRYNKKVTASRFQSFLFFFGILLLFAMVGSPLLSLSYLSFSLHMIQMSIVYFVVPPLLLLGVPSVSKDYLQQMTIIRIFQKISIPPMYALIAFATLFLLYHLPFVLTFINQHDVWPKLYLTLLFFLAMFMWSPIALNCSKNSDSKLNNYAKLSSVFIMPACLLFIISALMQEMNNPFMSDIAAHLCLPGDQLQILPPPFNTKYDQIISGVLMISIHKIAIVSTTKINSHLHVSDQE